MMGDMADWISENEESADITLNKTGDNMDEQTLKILWTAIDDLRERVHAIEMGAASNPRSSNCELRHLVTAGPKIAPSPDEVADLKDELADVLKERNDLAEKLAAIRKIVGKLADPASPAERRPVLRTTTQTVPLATEAVTRSSVTRKVLYGQGNRRSPVGRDEK